MTHKHFIAAVLAAAISISALAPAQARAGNDTAKIIAGAAALAIIGVAIAESSNRRNVYVTRDVHRHHVQPRNVHIHHHYRHAQPRRAYGHAHHHYRHHRNARHW